MSELGCLSPKQVAALLGVSERTAARLMASGAIHAFRVGPKLLRTTRAKLLEYQYKGKSIDLDRKVA
jgi:excisionase family DNA binding protein